MHKTIKFSAKSYTVNVADHHGNVLIAYASVPANSPDEARQLVLKKLSLTAEQTGQDLTFAPRRLIDNTIRTFDDAELVDEILSENKVEKGLDNNHDRYGIVGDFFKD